MSGIFNSAIFNNLIFNVGEVIDSVTRGGVADYRHYQKKLKRIAKAADQRLYGKVKKRVAALAKQELPQIIRTEVQEIQSTVDFGELVRTQSQENHVLLVNALKKLDQLLEEAMLKQQNEEEELIIMMILA